jgi:hypothetical protein
VPNLIYVRWRKHGKCKCTCAFTRVLVSPPLSHFSFLFEIQLVTVSTADLYSFNFPYYPCFVSLCRLQLTLVVFAFLSRFHFRSLNVHFTVSLIYTTNTDSFLRVPHSNYRTLSSCLPLSLDSILNTFNNKVAIFRIELSTL